jgi:diguanylate cyclase (GGDEF)-like protein
LVNPVTARLKHQAMSATVKKARILIADDDPQIREMLHALLHEDYDCVQVCSAEEALALLRTDEFDLVLSDIMMSGISGLEMVPEVLRLAPDTVVIMISGEQTVESAIAAMRVGAFDYITKPFDLRHVEAAVRRGLEHRALREAKRLYENHLEELVRQRTAERDHLAYHDALTGLPNRVLFEDRLVNALNLAHRNGQKLAVLALSLDRFKKFNDTLGHVMADRLLRGVAERLTGCVREGDTVARAEGDEFSLLLSSIGGTENVAEMARSLQECLKTPFALEGHELYVTASIGVGLYPDDGADTQTLLKNAGAALYRAKQQGGNNYQFYAADMNARAFKRLSLENQLRGALQRSEFAVYYQAQINSNTRQIVGAEALVRWQHPELGLVSPAEFIPLAEDTGLIAPIGEWVLRTACAQSRSWKEMGLEPLRIAVNLSQRQFQQTDLVEMVGSALTESGLNPGALELELTESSIMKNAEHAIATLRQLKEMGIKISIDDFGSGYSSLTYLKHLPLDTLKIDQSFVRDMTMDPNDAAIVMAIIALAHSLKLQVVAEGVETEDQSRFLHLLKCDEMQGYLFSRPLPAEAFERLLAEGDGRNMVGAISPSQY